MPWIPNTLISSGAAGGSDWDETIVKQVTQNSANNTFQNDDELFFAVDSTNAYYFEMVLSYDAENGSGVPDLKHTFVVSAGAFVLAWRQHIGISTTGTIQASQGADMTGTITNGTATTRVVQVTGSFTVNAPANVILQWSQNTNDADDTRVLAGSFIRYRELTP